MPLPVWPQQESHGMLLADRLGLPAFIYISKQSQGHGKEQPDRRELSARTTRPGDRTDIVPAAVLSRQQRPSGCWPDRAGCCRTVYLVSGIRERFEPPGSLSRQSATMSASSRSPSRRPSMKPESHLSTWHQDPRPGPEHFVAHHA